MAWIDWIILGVVGLSVLAGLGRGAVRTVLSIVGVVAGFVIATRESGAVGLVLANWMPERAAAVAGFLFVFLGITVVFALTAWLLRKVLEGLSLSWLDRLGGGVLGLLRGALFVGVLALAMEAAGVSPPKGSVTYPWALQAGRMLLELVPEETRERLDWDRLKDLMPDDLPERDDFI